MIQNLWMVGPPLSAGVGPDLHALFPENLSPFPLCGDRRLISCAAERVNRQRADSPCAIDENLHLFLSCRSLCGTLADLSGRWSLLYIIKIIVL